MVQSHSGALWEKQCSVFWNFTENHPLGIGEAPYRRVLIRAPCYKSAWGTEVLEKSSHHRYCTPSHTARTGPGEARALQEPTRWAYEWGRKTACLSIVSSESFPDGPQHSWLPKENLRAQIHFHVISNWGDSEPRHNHWITGTVGESFTWST